jgi:hypothetical protein
MKTAPKTAPATAAPSSGSSFPPITSWLLPYSSVSMVVSLAPRRAKYSSTLMCLRQAAPDRRTLNKAPIVERMTTAKTDRTMLNTRQHSSLPNYHTGQCAPCPCIHGRHNRLHGGRRGASGRVPTWVTGRRWRRHRREMERWAAGLEMEGSDGWSVGSARRGRSGSMVSGLRCDAMRRDVPTAAGTYAEMTNRGTWRGARALVGARFVRCCG